MSKNRGHQKITLAVYLIGLVIWVVVAMLGAQLLVGYPMIWLLGSSFTQPFWTLVYYTLYYGLALALIFWLPERIYKVYLQHHHKKQTHTAEFQTTKAQLGIQHLPTFVDIGLAPIGYIVYVVLAQLTVNIMSGFTWFNLDQAQDVGFSQFLGGAEKVYAMLAIVFIAPIAEELIMRGWLYGKLREKLKAPLAILLVSLLFAVLHGQWNVGIGVFILSLVLCSLREITGTIWSGLTLHILSNGIAFYLLYNLGL